MRRPRRRFFLVRWFQNWVYLLMQEKEQEFVWERSSDPCPACKHPIYMSAYRFCPNCGAPAGIQMGQPRQPGERQTSGAIPIVHAPQQVKYQLPQFVGKTLEVTNELKKAPHGQRPLDTFNNMIYGEKERRTS